MSCEWEYVTLQSITTVLGDGLHGTPEYCDEGGYYFINGNNLQRGKIVINENTKCVNLDQYKKHKKNLSGRTILVSINGTIGNVAYYNDEKVILGKSACYFNVVDNVDKDYIYYVVSSPDFQDFIEREATGTTIKNVSLKTVRKYSFYLPELSWQVKASRILSSLDKNITLNTQINQTLEQMAQALFKSWFVDFDPVIDNALEADNPIPEPLAEGAIRRQAMWAAGSEKAPARLPAETRRLFPDRFEEDEVLGWVPKGWKTKPLSQQITLIGGGTPKRSEKSFWDGDIPWFSVKDAPSESDVFVIDTEDKITQAGLRGSSAKLLPVGTTIITARGTVGKLAITGEEMAMNQSCYGVCPIKGLGTYYNFYNVKSAVVGLQQNVHGAVFDTITRQTFETVSSPLPNEDVVAEFESRVAVLMGKIKAAIEENISLTQLRGTLLPKLLSGELTVDITEDTEREAEEVMA